MLGLANLTGKTVTKPVARNLRQVVTEDPDRVRNAKPQGANRNVLITATTSNFSLESMLRRKSKRRQRRQTRSRQVQLQKLEPRQLLAATLGVTPVDTGEFLLGSVAVTPVFFESNGEIDEQTQNWSPTEIDEVLAKVTEGVNWWSDMLDTLDTVHTLDFVIDDTYAVNPVATPYEPIDRSSFAFNEYVGDFVTTLGYGDANSIEEAVQQFNHAQRERLNTDWAFTIFVIDSSDDPDGLFASGGFAAAFAFAGGLFMVTPSTRPASTIAHEMGHIFWARDEYAGGGSWNDTRGYYDTQNLNAVTDNPDPNFQQQISIMRGGVPLTSAYDAHVSPESTLAMVGWRDSDGDGVFDLADVPLSLDAVGYFDAESSLYHFSGTASAVPLINQNSSGAQSDITLNRVSELQYSLDDGPWLVAAEPNLQRVDFDLSLAFDQPFSSIQWRAIDQSTGVTSAILAGTPTLPALSAASVSGVAFVDDNADGQRNAEESALAETEIIIRNPDGSSLFGGAVDAADFPDGGLPDDLAGVTLATDGTVIDQEVGSFVSDDLSNQRVFHAYDEQRERWIDRWSKKSVFEASFDQAVGQVRLDVIGLDEVNYGRLEAYDAAGQMLTRVTSQAITAGQVVTLSVTDPLGRIASIRALGHNDTSVALNDLRFGYDGTLITHESGSWQFKNLPEGEYVVDLVPERLIHQFNQSSVTVQVSAGASDLIVAPAQRINSPRYNELLPEDANQDGIVTSADALVIINDLGRFNTRVLQASETTGFAIDVSNDGLVSALDALLVINWLGRSNGGNGGAGESEQTRFLVGHGSADPPLIPAETRIPQMFNSAGSVTPDESSDHLNADTSEQPLVGQGSLGVNSPVFSTNFQQSRSEPTESEDRDPEKATEPDQSLSPINAEISEPS